MADDLLTALRPLLTRLEAYLAAHPAVRAEVAAAARAVADWAAGPAAVPVFVPQPTPAPSPPEPEPVREPLPPLTFHLTSPPPAPRPVYAEPLANDGKEPPAIPDIIAARCRLKAEASRLRAAAGFDPTSTTGNELIGRAKQYPNCALWMLLPGDYNDAPAAWLDLAATFAAAAEAADLLRDWRLAPTDSRVRLADEVLHLIAEAQSAVLAAGAGVYRWGYDQDQLELFLHTSAEAKSGRVYVRRFLRKEDRADPTQSDDLRRRLAAAAGRVREASVRTRDRTKAMNNLRFKLRKLADDPTGRADDWPRVLELLDELVADGLPASNAEVRELLLPVLDHLPDGLDVPATADRVFREVDKYLADRPPADEPEARGDRFSAEVARAADLLEGRTVLLIGGQERPARRDVLARAFRLGELLWLTTREHTTITYFEPYIARPETAVVLLAIRWSSHDYAEVQQYCEKYGKLLVRLPGGYHPNQVAHQILNQVGDQLAAARARPA